MTRLLTTALFVTIGIAGPHEAMAIPTPHASAGPQDTVAPGLVVLRDVHARYASKRFRTVSFTQRTTFPDGRIEWWYEAEEIPGKARVDIAPFADRNMSIFRNDSAYIFRGGELTRTGQGLAPTMWTLMDMYAIPPEETARHLERHGYDLKRVHRTERNGRPIIVVGALAGDTMSTQLWLDAEHLYAVRMVGDRGGHRVWEFANHLFAEGGWIEREIAVYLNGERTLFEEYFDVQVNVALPADYFQPDRYHAPPWRETRKD